MNEVLSSPMARKVGKLMVLFACGILAMPQGWCCLVLSLGCCRAATAPHTEKPACCCCHQSKEAETPCCPDSKPAAPSKSTDKCTMCVSASQKPPTKVTGLDDLPTLAVVLPIPAPVARSSITLERLVLSHDTGPPRHVQLCVWRC